MRSRVTTADALAGVGSLAMGVGTYGLGSLDACPTLGDCSPIWVTLFGLVGGMLVTAEAKVMGAGPLGITLAFLGPGVGSIAGKIAGHSNPTAFVVGAMFTMVGLASATQEVTARVSRTREEAALAAMRPGIATVLSVRSTRATEAAATTRTRSPRPDTPTEPARAEIVVRPSQPRRAPLTSTDALFGRHSVTEPKPEPEPTPGHDLGMV
jgi:hypothetical protein